MVYNKDNFNSQDKEYLTLLAIQNKGDWNSIFNGIISNQEITINKDLTLMNLYYSGIRVVTIYEEEYPELLKNSYMAPFVLFYIGDLELVNSAIDSIGILGDDLEDAVVDELIKNDRVVTMVGKEQIEIKDKDSYVFVSTTFGEEMKLAENARMFSSLASEFYLDGSQETNFNMLVLMYANCFNMPVTITSNGWSYDVLGYNVNIVDSFDEIVEKMLYNK